MATSVKACCMKACPSGSLSQLQRSPMVAAVIVVVRGQDASRRPAIGAVADRHDRPAVGGLEHRPREDSGRAERDLPAIQAEHPVEAARLVDVVGRDEHAAALGGEAVDQRGQHAGAGRIDARERLVEQREARILHERAGDQHALSLASRELAERASARLSRARPPRVPRARGGARARPARLHHGRRETEPISGDIQSGDGVVEPRALRLRHDAAAAPSVEPAGERLELAEQGAEAASTCRRRSGRARRAARRLRPRTSRPTSTGAPP